MVTIYPSEADIKTCFFKELAIGDTFLDGKILCMVVPAYSDKTSTSAIYLSNGKIYPIHPDTQVQLVDIQIYYTLLHEK